MKLLVLSCLVAVCVASKVPNAPKFPETFSSDGEIEFHLAEKTLFGKCKCNVESSTCMQEWSDRLTAAGPLLSCSINCIQLQIKLCDNIETIVCRHNDKSKALRCSE